MKSISIKETLSRVILCVFVFVTFISFTACSSIGKIKISGKYFNETNSQIYIKFNKKNDATLYFNNNPIAYGRYEIDKQTKYLSILFVSGEVNGYLPFLLHDNNKSISTIGNSESNDAIYIGGTYIKEKSFWAKHWLKIIIALIILSVIQQILENQEMLEKIMKFFLNDEQLVKIKEFFEMGTELKEEKDKNTDLETNNNVPIDTEDSDDEIS